MKKRILSCLMALALCLTLLPTAALAADGAQAADGTGHPSHTDATKLWMDGDTLKKGDNPWTAESIPFWGSSNDDMRTVYVLKGGTYYLDSDLNFTGNTSIKGTECAIAITGNVTLCLNSHSITCTDKWSAISVYAVDCGSLTLTDCKTTGKITGGTTAAVDVRNGKTFNMYGGTLTGSSEKYGVYVNEGSNGTTKFNMSGGAITGGGVGVRLEGGEFTMSGGTISKNTANNVNGSGVFMQSGKFTMSGTAKITSNTAGRAGGGVYMSGGTFNMSGTAKITGNTANTAGGGVCVENGTFTVSGTPTVSENTSGSVGNKVTGNVYLCANKTITINSGLTNGTNIGVTTGSAKAPTEDSTIAITTPTSNAHGYLSYFKSDNDSYEIVANSEQTQLVLKAKPKIDLTNSAVIKITSQSADLVYTGKPITVAYEVKYNNTTLMQGKDYAVTGNSGTDATDYTLKITGTGQYTGKVEKKWKITPLTVNVSSVTLREKEYDGTCNGSSSDVTSVKFTKGSSDSDIVTLQSGDYTIESVTYGDANAGTQNADIVIKLKENGNYTFAGSNKLTAQVGTQGKITQASANNLTAQTGEINVVNNKADSYTLDLSTLLPTPSAGTLGNIENYTLDTVNLANGYYDSSDPATINGSKLTLPIKAANSAIDGNQIGTVKVKVTTQNYTDITLTINVKAVAAPLKDPVYTPPKAKTPTYNRQAQKLITGGTVTEGGTMKYCLSETGEYSTDIPMATNAGDYTVYYKVVGDSGYSDTAVQSIPVHINKAKPTGEPIYTKITAAKKTLADAALKPNTSWPTGTVKWELGDTTEVKANTAYKWIFTPAAEFEDNYTTADGELTLYSVSTGGGGGGSGSYDSNPIIKTETKNNPDGSVTKTETKRDGTVIETTTGKDGSVSKTETKKDGSSVTENKAADGSTGTVKTDKDGKTEASAKLSDKAVENAKKSGEPVKAPVEVKATRDSDTAPTVKIELPRNSSDTKVEIPVSNMKPGTVAVLVHPDGTEEILKNSLPTEDGIQLTVNGGATVKIVDNSKDFADTRNHWAKDAIDFVSARGLVNGMNAVSYAPNASTTRAQLWTILARQNDADLTGGATWFENAQNWAKEKGISDGTNPNGTINRAQMVTMLWRTMGQPAAASGASFADVPADSYYAQAVAWAIENDITAGVGGGRFDPNSTCTRGQIATFLYRYMK